jgi:hypothetical protein
MLRYFTFRPTSADEGPVLKRWLYDELKAGRLRQGWLSEISLVTPSCKVVPRENWVARARASIIKSTWARKARFKKSSFCPEKYDELSTMVEIEEGDIVVVPSIDSNGGKAGFALATAVPSGRGARSKGCYWYDSGRPDYRHVLSVRVSHAEPTFFSNATHNSLSTNLSHRIKPVQRIRDEKLIEAVTSLRAFFQPPAGPLPPFALGKEKRNRKTIERQIAARQGQGPFRQNLLTFYSRQCAISTCGVPHVLEAAHIVPHSISALDDERNGILLRADLHTLFDKGLLGINPDTRKVELHPDIRETYGSSRAGEFVTRFLRFSVLTFGLYGIIIVDSFEP